MPEITFFVPGVARPGGSKRALPVRTKSGGTRTVLVDMGKDNKSWRNMIASTASEKWHGELLRCPLTVRFTFLHARPAGHFGKNGHLLPSVRPYPTVKPDVLKLARAAEDALTGIVWHDDAQTVSLTTKKRYCHEGETPGVWVLVEWEDGKEKAA